MHTSFITLFTPVLHFYSIVHISFIPLCTSVLFPCAHQFYSLVHTSFIPLCTPVLFPCSQQFYSLVHISFIPLCTVVLFLCAHQFYSYLICAHKLTYTVVVCKINQYHLLANPNEALCDGYSINNGFCH